MTEEGKIDTGAGEARRVPWLDIVVLAVIGLVLVVIFRVIGMYLAIALNIAWRLIVRRPVHHNQRLLWTCVFGAPVAFVVVTLIAAPFSPAMLHAPWLRSAIDVAVIPMPLDRILLALLGAEVPGGDWIMTQFAKPVWYAQFYTPLYPAIFLGFCAGMAWFAVTLPVFSQGDISVKLEVPDEQRNKRDKTIGLVGCSFALLISGWLTGDLSAIVASGSRSTQLAPLLSPICSFFLLPVSSAFLARATITRSIHRHME